MLRGSAGTIYRVLVKSLPAPPPTHPINQQGDPPTALDQSWIATANNGFANASCADTTTPFQWCQTVVSTTDPGAFHLSTHEDGHARLVSCSGWLSHPVPSGFGSARHVPLAP